MSQSNSYNFNDGFFNTFQDQQFGSGNGTENNQYMNAAAPAQAYNSPFVDPNSFYGNQSQQQQGAYFYQPNDYFANTVSAGVAADSYKNNSVNFEQEPPLLEELGINFEHIYRKTICVLNPFSRPHETIIHDTDLAGPLVFCIAYGFSLLLLGKVQFGYVYGITALGCVCMYSLLNLMSDNGVSAICISSTLGYCLLPMVILSFLSQVITIKSFHGLILAFMFILWCSVSASKLFVYALNMSNQQALVLYPCSLLYGIFALLNIF